MQLAERTCGNLGVPLALEKSEGPACLLGYLGIMVDTARLEPEEKLGRLAGKIAEWQLKRSCTKKELRILSLIGHLQHASRVIKPGRPFLRRMIDLSMTVDELHYHIPLRAAFKSDLHWWALFMRKWNGVCMMASLDRKVPGVTLTSDASGK